MTYSSKLNKKMSKNGIEFLTFLEGEKLNVYNDAAGFPTIGVGHKLKDGESFTTISPEKSRQLLKADLRESEKAVSSLVEVPLNQNQFDSLVSFVFNIGANAFKSSTLLKKLNSLDYFGAMGEFKRWNNVTINGVKSVNNGLTNRRLNEADLFNS